MTHLELLISNVRKEANTIMLKHGVDMAVTSRQGHAIICALCTQINSLEKRIKDLENLVIPDAE